MPNNNGKSDGGASFHSNGPHKEGDREQNANMSPERLEMQTLYSQGPAEAEARAEQAYAKWKSKQALDDLIGKDTDKITKQVCVAEVTQYHNSARFAENRPNSEAIQALA